MGARSRGSQRGCAGASARGLDELRAAVLDDADATGVLLERDVRLERCRLPHLQAAPERARRRPRDRLHARMLGTVHGDARRELLEVLRADQRGHGHDDPGPSVPHARAPGAVVADDLALPVVEVDPLPKYATLLSRLQIAY